MLNKKTIIQALGFTLTAATLTACGEPVDTESTNEALSTNLQAMSQATQTNIKVMSSSKMFGQLESNFIGDDSSSPSPDCAPGDSFCEPGGGFEEPQQELDAEFSQAADAAIAFLNERVFIDAHIEEQKRSEVTYLLKGATVCADLQAGSEDFTACKDTVDAAQIRLVVTSPREGDVSVAVLVSSSRHNPFSVDVWSDTLAAEVDLGGVRKSLEHIAQVVNEPELTAEIPETFEGRVRGELKLLGTNKLKASFGVMSALKVKDAQGSYDVSVAKANPAVSATFDAPNEKFSVTQSWNAIDLTYPETSYSWDDNGNETQSTHTFKLHTDALKGSLVLDAASELISLNGISLGANAATLDVDAKRVFEMVLTDGFDIELSEQQDLMKAVFSGDVTLNMDFSFEEVMGAVQDLDVDDWMLDEQLTFSVKGASPTLLLDDEGDIVQVVAGELTMAAAQRNVTVTASADQCLVDAGSQNEPAVCTSDDTECGFEVTGDSHPFEGLSSGPCE